MSQIRTQVGATGQVHVITADRVDLLETAAALSALPTSLALPLTG